MTHTSTSKSPQWLNSLAPTWVALLTLAYFIYLASFSGLWGQTPPPPTLIIQARQIIEALDQGLTPKPSGLFGPSPFALYLVDALGLRDSTTFSPLALGLAFFQTIFVLFLGIRSTSSKKRLLLWSLLLYPAGKATYFGFQTYPWIVFCQTLLLASAILAAKSRFLAFLMASFGLLFHPFWIWISIGSVILYYFSQSKNPQKQSFTKWGIDLRALIKALLFAVILFLFYRLCQYSLPYVRWPNPEILNYSKLWFNFWSKVDFWFSAAMPNEQIKPFWNHFRSFAKFKHPFLFWVTFGIAHLAIIGQILKKTQSKLGAFWFEDPTEFLVVFFPWMTLTWLYGCLYYDQNLFWFILTPLLIPSLKYSPLKWGFAIVIIIGSTLNAQTFFHLFL